MRSERRKQIMTLSILVVAVLVVSIGFAAFSSTLRINPSVTVNPNASDFSVKFSTTKDTLTVAEVVPTNYTQGIKVTNGKINNSGDPTISNLSVEFQNPGDYVEYVFYARNEGEYTAYLNNINFFGEKTCLAAEGTSEKLVESACSSIGLTLTVGGVDYTSATVLTDHVLDIDAGEEIKVTIKYADNGERTDGKFNVDFGQIAMVYSTVNDPTTPFASICTNITGDKDTPGSKYECEVKPGTKYNFYVLSTEADGTTNLIMDRNMCSDGTPTSDSKTDKCYVLWHSSNTLTEGPVAAMEYLNNATSSWSNIKNLDITYDDEGGSFTDFRITGKARMPYKKEVNFYNGNNAFLYDNLANDDWSDDKPINNMDIYGYWTLSSPGYSSEEMFGKLHWYVWAVELMGSIVEDWTDSASYGVRPVINVQL